LITSRVLQKGDIINMELAAGYRGYTAQIGLPICVGAASASRHSASLPPSFEALRV
jgi:hypothetical protein